MIMMMINDDNCKSVALTEDMGCTVHSKPNFPKLNNGKLAEKDKSAISNKQIELKKLIDTHEDYLTTSSDEIKDKTRSIKDLKEQEGSLIFKIEEYKSNLAGLVEKESELAATLKSNVTNLENVNLLSGVW